MELDDMKLAWQRLDQHLARSHALDLVQHRERRLGSVRLRLLPLKAGLVARMVTGVALVVAAAAFWSSHFGALHLVASGALLQAYGLLLVGSAAWEMQLLHGVDHAGPVLAIQRQLARLAAFRVRMVPVWMASGCFVWIPLTLAVFKAAFGADLYANAPEVIGWFVASGFVALLGFWLVPRLLPSVGQAMNDSSVGTSLVRSQRMLDEVARFESEG